MNRRLWNAPPALLCADGPELAVAARLLSSNHRGKSRLQLQLQKFQKFLLRVACDANQGVSPGEPVLMLISLCFLPKRRLAFLERKCGLP